MSAWVNIDENWYLFNEFCIMQTGWVRQDNVWYYLDESGTMKTGWLCEGPNGPWYYLDLNTGAMLYDTITPDGYYIGSDGTWKS